MKLRIFSFKSDLDESFTAPFYDDRPVENMIEGITRSIINSKNPEAFRHKSLYVLGEFDDKTGEIKPCEKELLFDCNTVVARLENGIKESKN